MGVVPNQSDGRKTLPHDPPHFIGTSDATFFLTICCKPRGLNQLCHPDVAAKIFGAARHYYELHHWTLPLVLLMPDHLHMLARFSEIDGMAKVVRNWKHYIATHVGIKWQRDFFDHRLRAEESVTDKAGYILNNPVRGGLIERAEDWIYQISLA